MNSEQPTPSDGRRGQRTLTWWQFLVVAVIYVAIIQIAGLILGSGIEDPERQPGDFLRAMLLPVALSMLFTVGVAFRLGWWQPILHEPMRVRRWVWIVPGLLAAGAIAGASWGNLLDQKTELVLYLVLLVSMVGFTEELMFRGIGLVAFRRAGFTEAKVALFTSIIFGAAHLSNAISTGSTALFQAAVVSVSGYFFYLTRRVSGTIVVAMLVHASQDFTYLSGEIGIDPSQFVGVMIMIPIMVGLAITLLARRKKIEPETQAKPAARG